LKCDVVQTFKRGHVTLITPFQGWFVICRQGLAMVNLPTKFEVYISRLCRYQRHCKI